MRKKILSVFAALVAFATISASAQTVVEKAEKVVDETTETIAKDSKKALKKGEKLIKDGKKEFRKGERKGKKEFCRDGRKFRDGLTKDGRKISELTQAERDSLRADIRKQRAERGDSVCKGRPTVCHEGSQAPCSAPCGSKKACTKSAK